MIWSALLHFIGATTLLRVPGKNGWAGTKRVNILDGMKNVTALLQGWVKGETSDDAANKALKFLIHFFGDAHQPMHMTGRERGGNQVNVTFGGKQTSQSFLLLYLDLTYILTDISLRPAGTMGRLLHY